MKRDLLDALAIRRRHAFGAVIRLRRKGLRYSQEALAAKAAVDRQSIHRWEAAKYSPCLDEMWSLADALSMDLSEIMRAAENIVNPPMPPTREDAR